MKMASRTRKPPYAYHSEEAKLLRCAGDFLRECRGELVLELVAELAENSGLQQAKGSKTFE
jgi:hypothetical protein